MYITRMNYNTDEILTQIYKWMEDVERENPELVSSAVYGHTFEGKNIALLKFGLQNPEGKEKKVIWMDCGIHAREWIAPAFCQWFVKEIVTSYKTNKKLEQMLQNLDVYVTPVINVDGYMYTWVNTTTRIWRKSRSTPPSGNSCLGVDLNRNFNANWGTVGVSFDSCANTYCGKEAGSEPEATAVMDFVGKMVKQTLCFLTIHSAGQLILLPYGHPQISAPNYDELIQTQAQAATGLVSSASPSLTPLSCETKVSSATCCQRIRSSRPARRRTQERCPSSHMSTTKPLTVALSLVLLSLGSLW
ncbi:carboxypeptidase O-like isoform X3 [Gymnodraco acuticeps]|uniref:Carboxypeptidase O-like isoform X3 n=1 Tax=Gymnodraco acuticeps TaxID=8218 RepID=A0A6P8W6D0_GYMAC|nr:carboxypeptidase O-like isoform X3 [Gymnodraco acuticeps]